MKLGIIASPSEDSFKYAVEKNLEFLEFCLNVGYNLNDFLGKVEDLKGWIKKYNVEIGSVGTWATDKVNKDGSLIEDELQNSYKLIDAARELGCTNFVTGVNYVEELSYYENCTAAINFFSKLIEYGKTRGIKISSVNCRWNNFVADPMAWKVIHGYLKDLGIKFDPSHSIYDGGDYLKEIRDWGHRFNHVHIKGSLIIDGQRFDDPPAGLDATDWKSFMAALYGVKYDGTLSIEPHSHNWTGELGQKGVDYTINYIRPMIL